VPILRKKLDALGYTKPLRQYLAKYRNATPDLGGFGVLPPGPGRGTHWHANSTQSVICFGGEGQFSCFDPFTASSEEFSLIQIGLSNSDLPSRQTVEAGWQEYQDIMGDWVPHLFVYYTTNGHAKDADNEGGYNMDVDGWVQHDDVIFPGSTLLPFSVIGGEQRKISLKYQLFKDNCGCRARAMVGYYPARSSGNQAYSPRRPCGPDCVLGRSGELQSDADSDRHGQWSLRRMDAAAYFHHLRVQTDRAGGWVVTTANSRTDRNLYASRISTATAIGKALRSSEVRAGAWDRTQHRNVAVLRESAFTLWCLHGFKPHRLLKPT
jgi:hypothetical protein